jgi:hypothetical protein
MDNSRPGTKTVPQGSAAPLVPAPGIAAAHAEAESKALVPQPGTALDPYEAAYEAARQALAVAKNVPDVKDILSIAAAMGAYARMAKDRDLESDAIELRFRAERRLGQMIAVQKATVGLAKGTAGKGRQKKGGSRKDPPKDVPSLADVGIDKHLADRARKMAAPPDDKFEDHIRFCRGRFDPVYESQRVLERYRDKDDLNDAELRTLSSRGRFRMNIRQIDYEEALRLHEDAIEALRRKYQAEANSVPNEFYENRRPHQEAIEEIDSKVAAAVAVKKREFDEAVAAIEKEFDEERRPHQAAIDKLRDEEQERVAAIQKEYEEAAGPHREAIKEQRIMRKDALKAARLLRD